MGTVKLTQFVHPHGRPRGVECQLPDKLCEMATHQILTCECAPHNYAKVILYSRLETDEEEEEDVEFAPNVPDGHSLKDALTRLIRRVDQRRTQPVEQQKETEDHEQEAPHETEEPAEQRVRGQEGTSSAPSAGAGPPGGDAFPGVPA